MKLKVCGMREPDNIAALEKLRPDFIGLNFYEHSSRFIGNSISPQSLTQLDENISKVGVFVNADENYILEKADQYNLKFIQLHGDETIEYCQLLKKQKLNIIKVFRVDLQFDFEETKHFQFCDYFLFDTYTPDFGGSGNIFNWKLLDQYKSNIPFFLAGGIDLENIRELKNMYLPFLFAIDINSKFEIDPGIKDIQKIKTLQNIIHGL